MKVLALFVVLVVLIPMVGAEEITTISGFQVEGLCVNSTHLNKTIPLYIDGDLTELTTGPTFCPFGCVENATQYGDDCRDRDPFKTGMAGAFLLVVSIIFLIMAKLSAKPIDVLFSFMALFTLIASLLVGSLVTVTHYPEISSLFDTVYFVSILTIMPVFVWFVFTIFRDVLVPLGKGGKKR